MPRLIYTVILWYSFVVQPFCEGRDLARHVPACSKDAKGVLGPRGGVGVLGLSPSRCFFCWGGGGGGQQRVCSPVSWSPTGNRPTACTLALWWLKFGPTGRLQWGGGGKVGNHEADKPAEQDRLMHPNSEGPSTKRPLLHSEWEALVLEMPSLTQEIEDSGASTSSVPGTDMRDSDRELGFSTDVSDPAWKRATALWEWDSECSTEVSD